MAFYYSLRKEYLNDKRFVRRILIIKNWDTDLITGRKVKSLSYNHYEHQCN